MSSIYLAPTWFFGYDVALELFFALISLVIALFAYRLYRITDQRQANLLGTSFFLISIAYFIQSIFNFAIISRLNQSVCVAMKLSSITAFDFFGAYAHMIFMLAGLIVLLYMTFSIQNKKILAFMLIIGIATMLFGNDSFLIFYLVSTICLAFISWHFISNYLKKKQALTLLVALAFLFLLFGSVHYFLAVDHSLYYVISHFLELAAYILILINFYLVRKK